MSMEMTENTSCCSGSDCGCKLDIYTTSEQCPECGKKLRMTGHAQIMEFRLVCTGCGYAGPLLSREEIGTLL